jgi:hypothetical protein
LRPRASGADTARERRRRQIGIAEFDMDFVGRDAGPIRGGKRDHRIGAVADLCAAVCALAVPCGVTITRAVAGPICEGYIVAAQPISTSSGLRPRPYVGTLPEEFIRAAALIVVVYPIQEPIPAPRLPTLLSIDDIHRSPRSIVRAAAYLLPPRT